MTEPFGEQLHADMGARLVAELDNIAPTLDQMARPFARASEMTRRVELARAYLSEFGCIGNDGTECAPCHCHLERILDGDI